MLDNLFGDIDPERRNAVLLIGGIAAIVVFALALIAFGYYKDRIEPRRDAVLRVGDRTYTYSFLERRIESDIARGRFNTSDIVEGISQSVATIQREEVVRIMARQRGLTATQAEIDGAIRTELGLRDDVSHDEMAGRLRLEILRIKLPLTDYLEIMEARVLEDKIRHQLGETLPREAEQLNLLLLAAGSQARALQAVELLESGMAFEDVAQAMYVGTGPPDGNFGWAPREVLDPELADVAFSITGRSGVIETERDFYVIEVLDKEQRPVDDDIRAEYAEREFSKLLEEALDNTIFVYDLTDQQIIRLAGVIRGSFGG